MELYSYLTYLHQNLGLREFLSIPWVPSQEVVDTPDTKENPATENLSAVSSLHSQDLWTAESTFQPQNHYEVLFVRINSGFLSLREDASASELLGKLRAAIGYTSATAPWVEVDLGLWCETVELLKLQSDKILLLFEDKIEKPSSHFNFWIIPDPHMMSLQTKLKRPAWELLKEWKQND